MSIRAASSDLTLAAASSLRTPSEVQPAPDAAAPEQATPPAGARSASFVDKVDQLLLTAETKAAGITSRVLSASATAMEQAAAKAGELSAAVQKPASAALDTDAEPVQPAPAQEEQEDAPAAPTQAPPAAEPAGGSFGGKIGQLRATAGTTAAGITSRVLSASATTLDKAAVKAGQLSATVQPQANEEADEQRTSATCGLVTKIKAMARKRYAGAPGEEAAGLPAAAEPAAAEPTMPEPAAAQPASAAAGLVSVMV
jgi:hypothetical protein